MLIASCSNKTSNISNANNTEFNLKYKNSTHIMPLYNLCHVDIEKNNTQTSDAHYQQKKSEMAQKYQSNQNYFNFLNKNDFHSKFKGITIESMPKENYHYIELAKNKNTASELNKLNQMEIEYVFFLRQQMLAKERRDFHGDAITHPLTYEAEKRTDTQIVMGDEYQKWNSVNSL